MFPNLAQPIKIGKLELPNRIITAPMVHSLATEEGHVTERLMDAYRAKGRGGWGLVMAEASYVNRNHTQFNRMLGIYDDRLIGGLGGLAEAVKEGGSKVAIQIQHPGWLAPARWNKVQMVAPSNIGLIGLDPRNIAAKKAVVPRALTAEEVDETINDFVAAALRAKTAGFDLVMIHAAHGFLIHQFISPYFNKRDDKWGEPSALVVEVIKRVREAVGPDYPVSIRISGAEYVGEGDANLELMLKLAPLLVEAGVDCIDVSAGNTSPPGNVWLSPTIYFNSGCIVHLAEAIKKVVPVPVVTVGKINDPALAEEIVAQGRADLVAFGRGSLADPELAKKALEGRVDEIRRCIWCLKCSARVADRGIMCAINYEAGRPRYEYEISPAVHSRKVMVVGGGPAGMEAARVAALRGHEVTLYERQSELGGQLIPAAVPPHKQDLALLNRYLAYQLEKSAVQVKLGVEVTPELVEKERPDAVILATGLMSLIPEIPGVSGSKVAAAIDVLLGKVNVGEKVVVIGGELVGCETADFLSEQGKKVTVVRRGPEMIAKMIARPRGILLARLEEKGVALVTGVKEYEAITEDGLVMTDGEGKRRTLEADTIVLAAGAIPNDQMAKAIKGKVPEVYEIGDCVQPLHIMNAIHSANRVAREI